MNKPVGVGPNRGAQASPPGDSTRSEAAGAGRRGSGHRNEAAIGVAIVLGVLLLFFGVQYLDDGNFLSSSYEIQAEFRSADGLLAGSRVMLSGVEIGEVSKLRLLPRTHRVKVVMAIDGNVEIPRGAEARIKGIAALDDMHVVIMPGAPDAEPLADGDEIAGVREPALADRADSTLAELDQTFEHAQSLLANTESDLGLVLNHLQTASGGAASFVESEQGRLRHAVANIQAAAAELNRVAAHLNYVASEGGDTLVVAIHRLSATMRRLDAAAESFDRTSAYAEKMMMAIDAGEGTIGRMVHDPSLYARLDSAAARLDTAAARMGDLLQDFKDDPGRYLGKMSLIDIF